MGSEPARLVLAVVLTCACGCVESAQEDLGDTTDASPAWRDAGDDGPSGSADGSSIDASGGDASPDDASMDDASVGDASVDLAPEDSFAEDASPDDAPADDGGGSCYQGDGPAWAADAGCGMINNPDDFSDQVILAYCMGLVRCGELAPGLLQACIASEKTLDAQRHFGRWVPRDSVANGRVGFDPQAACACVASFVSRTCFNWIPLWACGSKNSYFFPWTAHRPVFPAKVPLGGDCGESLECLNGWCSCGGKCVAFLAMGDACTNDEMCGPDSACGSQCPLCPDTCAPLGAEGDPCGDISFCKPGLGCRESVCAPLGKLGETGCSLIAPCEDGLYCRSFKQGASSCQSLVPIGCACVHVNGQGFEGCNPGSGCVTRFPQTIGVCTAWGDVNSPCDPAHPCAGGTYCVNGRCEADDVPEGSFCNGACGADFVQSPPGLYCDDNVQQCRKRAPLGAACTPNLVPGVSDQPCLEGACVNNICTRLSCG